MNGKSDQAKWRDLFQEQRVRLAQAARMLMCRQEDPNRILASALGELKDSRFDEVFGPAWAVREVVKATIARNQLAEKQEIEPAMDEVLLQSCLEPFPLEALPWLERAAYFLREVLHYARRDTALLLGLSDGNVDQLTRFAKKRIAIFDVQVVKSPQAYEHPIRSIGATSSLAFAPYK